MLSKKFLILTRKKFTFNYGNRFTGNEDSVTGNFDSKFPASFRSLECIQFFPAEFIRPVWREYAVS